MAKPGRKPKPKMLKLLDGNAGRKPINHDEPTCDLPPVKPLMVAADPVASHEWDRVIAAMPPGLYSALDVGLLATYAQAWSMFTQAENEIRLNGITFKEIVKDANGNMISAEIKRNPAVIVWNQSVLMVLRASEQLGLSPTARARLKLPANRNAKASKFDGLIGANALTE